MKTMNDLSERFTAIGIAWNELLTACKKGAISAAKNEKAFIIGYINNLMGDGILTYDDKVRYIEEMQSHISEAERKENE